MPSLPYHLQVEPQPVWLGEPHQLILIASLMSGELSRQQMASKTNWRHKPKHLIFQMASQATRVFPPLHPQKPITTQAKDAIFSIYHQHDQLGA